MIHYCDQCDYKSAHKWSVRRHMQAKHKHVARKHGNDHSAPSQAGSGAVKSIQPDSQKEKHSNLQEASVDQLYENIDQWQKAFDTLKEQFQQVEKVTTCFNVLSVHMKASINLLLIDMKKLNILNQCLLLTVLVMM